MFTKNIYEIPKGYSEMIYEGEKYGVTRTDFNNGKSLKVFAQQLGGSNIVSFNFYVTSSSENLFPCEMPKEKVIHFLRNVIMNNEN